jgi:hypothetical protein
VSNLDWVLVALCTFVLGVGSTWWILDSQPAKLTYDTRVIFMTAPVTTPLTVHVRREVRGTTGLEFWEKGLCPLGGDPCTTAGIPYLLLPVSDPTPSAQSPAPRPPAAPDNVPRTHG